MAQLVNQQSLWKELSKVEDFKLDRDTLKSVGGQRELYTESIGIGYENVNSHLGFSHELSHEIDEINKFKGERAKKTSTLDNVTLGCGAAATAISIATVAVTLATGGWGIILGAVAIVPKFIEAGTSLASGILRMKDDTDQATITKLREERDLTQRKVSATLDACQQAMNIIHVLWKTSVDIMKNIAASRVNI